MLDGFLPTRRRINEATATEASPRPATSATVPSEPSEVPAVPELMALSAT
jgi:hypothetical protein